MRFWDAFRGVIFRSENYLARRLRNGSVRVINLKIHTHNIASLDALGAYVRAVDALQKADLHPLEKSFAMLNIGERFCDSVLSPDTLAASMFTSGDTAKLLASTVIAFRDVASAHDVIVFQDHDFCLWFRPAFQQYRMVALRGGRAFKPSRMIEKKLSDVLDAAARMGLGNQAQRGNPMMQIYRAFCLSVASGETGEIAGTFLGSPPEMVALIFGTIPRDGENTL